MSNLGIGYTQDLRTPITHVGRVVQNARIDDLEYTTRKYANVNNPFPKHYQVTWAGDAVLGNPELMHVSRFSILIKNQKDSMIGNWNGDTDLRVFDCVNTMSKTIDLSAPKDDFLNKELMTIMSRGEEDQMKFTLVSMVEQEHVEFGGVAATDGAQVGFDPRAMGGEPREIVSQLGGLTTVINTGLSEIKTGDIVVWYLPVHLASIKHSGGTIDSKSSTNLEAMVAKKNGLPANKCVIQVKSLNDALNDKMYQQYCLTPLDYVDSSTDALAEYHRRRMLPYHKIIGRAISGAKPGHPFDLMLGNYSS